MNCDSKTVYSALYHHPVMTPFEVRLPKEHMAEYFQRSSNHGSHIGNRSCHVKQVCMQLATPTNVGYTFQERINYPYVPQDGRGLPSNNQTGGFSVENSQRVDNMCSHAYNMKTRGVRHTPCSAGVNNYNISGFSDNSKPMYNLLLNVGQLQLSSYHMEVNGNATLYEQTYSGHDYHNDCQLGSNCQSVDATLPSSCFPMQPWHVVNTGHHTLQPQSHSIAYPWQFTHGQDFRSWNINRLLLSSQPYQIDSMQISTDGNTLTTSRFRNEVPISSSSLNFRPVKDLVQPVDNYFNHSSRSFDDNTSTTRTSQDSDIDSLESFGSGPYIDQIDMTANQLSDFSPHGPRSPESFRGDTPHPELWCMD
ncbi:uncharacterized protein LOC132542993 [Ylistrum balloti]|uniref:uncharacterized protein LOC132542993 n=1 Tax=Ylistrum balloti TaxID=509963 RepID=UPI002905E45D|nr:uncharacterized protein LOC132542993 [Ylistrum balloti]